MLTLDGAHGEGGGQILRSSLALSMITGTPFRMARVRAGRSRPGLLRQHLTAVTAAATVCGAVVTGDHLGSMEVTFRPGRVQPGDYTVRIGTAGSTTLVLQTVLPALMLAAGPSTVVLEGGTHNPMAPPADFLARVFLPLVARMGPTVTLAVERHGFFPAGGGLLRATVHPVPALTAMSLADRGPLVRCDAVARVAGVRPSVAMRELAALGDALGWPRDALQPEVLDRRWGPGNVLLATVESQHVTEMFTGIGERGVSSEDVARGVAQAVRAYLAVDVPVGEHLADQLLLPMALAGEGTFRTVAPSGHTVTHMDVLRQFLEVDTTCTEEGGGAWRVTVQGRHAVHRA